MIIIKDLFRFSTGANVNDFSVRPPARFNNLGWTLQQAGVNAENAITEEPDGTSSAQSSISMKTSAIYSDYSTRVHALKCKQHKYIKQLYPVFEITLTFKCNKVFDLNRKSFRFHPFKTLKNPHKCSCGGLWEI